MDRAEGAEAATSTTTTTGNEDEDPVSEIEYDEGFDKQSDTGEDTEMETKDVDPPAVSTDTTEDMEGVQVTDPTTNNTGKGKQKVKAPPGEVEQRKSTRKSQAPKRLINTC